MKRVCSSVTARRAHRVTISARHRRAEAIRTIFAALAVTILLVGAATAETFDDAAAAYERGEHAAAAKLMQTLAEQGDVKAQYALGVMCAQGYGVPQNEAQAMKWFQLAD